MWLFVPLEDEDQKKGICLIFLILAGRRFGALTFILF